jgi:hypothetical protein
MFQQLRVGIYGTTCSAITSTHTVTCGTLSPSVSRTVSCVSFYSLFAA